MKRIMLWILLLCLTGTACATVSNLPYTVTFACTGGYGPFPFSFPISDPTALTVTLNGTLLPPTAYTVISVNMNYANGGSVTLGSLYPCTQTLVLTRVTPVTQNISFYDNMPIPMKTFERSLDKLTEILQETGSGNGSGNVTGPSTSNDGDCAVYDGITGKLLKDVGPCPSSMIYPATGIANSSGTAWGTSYNASNTIPFNFLTMSYGNVVGLWAGGGCTGYLYSDGTCSTSSGSTGWNALLSGTNTTMLAKLAGSAIVEPAQLTSGATWGLNEANVFWETQYPSDSTTPPVATYTACQTTTQKITACAANDAGDVVGICVNSCSYPNFPQVALTGNVTYLQFDATHAVVAGDWVTTSSISGYGTDTGSNIIPLCGNEVIGQAVASGLAGSVTLVRVQPVPQPSCSSFPGTGTVTHSAGALNLNTCMFGNAGGDSKVDTNCTTDMSGHIGASSFTASGPTQIIDPSIPNASSGTTVYKLTKIVGGQALTATTSDTTIQLYAEAPTNTVAGCAPGTTGNACLVTLGYPIVTADASGITLNHYVGASTTIAGDVTDLGSSPNTPGCLGQAAIAAISGSAIGAISFGNCGAVGASNLDAAAIAKPTVASSVGGTADAITITLVPALVSQTQIGTKVSFIPGASNVTTTPTITVSGLTPLTAKKQGPIGLIPVAAGDIVLNETATVELGNIGASLFWVLDNPKNINVVSIIATGSETVGSGVYATPVNANYTGGTGNAQALSLQGGLVSPNTAAGAANLWQKVSNYAGHNWGHVFTSRKESSDPNSIMTGLFTQIADDGGCGAGGGSCFIEGIDGYAFLNHAGIAATAGAAFGVEAAVGTTGVGIPFVILTGVESGVFNFTGTDAPTTFYSTSQISTAFLADCGNGGSPSMCDSAYLVNPFAGNSFRVGFFVPYSQGDPIHTVTEADFRSQNRTAKYGMDLGGVYSTAALNITSNTTPMKYSQTGNTTCIPTGGGGGIGSTGTCMLETGSTDLWGVMVLTPGGSGIGNLGDETLQLSANLGTNLPVCVFTLAYDTTGVWQSRATAIITGRALNAITLNWDNNGIGLTSGSTYAITYMCQGK